MVKLRKEIKKYGDALVLRFNKDERKLLNIEVGKVYDIEMEEIKQNG